MKRPDGQSNTGVRKFFMRPKSDLLSKIGGRSLLFSPLPRTRRDPPQRPFVHTNTHKGASVWACERGGRGTPRCARRRATGADEARAPGVQVRGQGPAPLPKAVIQGLEECELAAEFRNRDGRRSHADPVRDSSGGDGTLAVVSRDGPRRHCRRGGRADLAARQEMVEPDGQIRVTCEYCSKTYAIEPGALRNTRYSNTPKNGSASRYDA